MRFRAILALMCICSSASADDCRPGRKAITSGQFADALAFFNKLAVKNSACAYYHLGVMYGIGRGVNQDRLKSQEYFKKAYEIGGQQVADFEVQQTLKQGIKIHTAHE